MLSLQQLRNFQFNTECGPSCAAKTCLNKRLQQRMQRDKTQCATAIVKTEQTGYGLFAAWTFEPGRLS